MTCRHVFLSGQELPRLTNRVVLCTCSRKVNETLGIAQSWKKIAFYSGLLYLDKQIDKSIKKNIIRIEKRFSLNLHPIHRKWSSSPGRVENVIDEKYEIFMKMKGSIDSWKRSNHKTPWPFRIQTTMSPIKVTTSRTAKKRVSLFSMALRRITIRPFFTRFSRESISMFCSYTSSRTSICRCSYILIYVDISTAFSVPAWTRSNYFFISSSSSLAYSMPGLS